MKRPRAYPELRWLNTYHLVPGILLAVSLWLVGQLARPRLGFFVSTSLLWHGTFSINSLAHCWGRRRYATTDDSKNSLLLALITMGEGWHNNHHYYQRSTRQGFFWWEIDCTYYILRALSLVGLVWDLHSPPKAVLEGNIDAGRPRAVRAPVAALPEPEATAEAAAE